MGLRIKGIYGFRGFPGRVEIRILCVSAARRYMDFVCQGQGEGRKLSCMYRVTYTVDVTGICVVGMSCIWREFVYVNSCYGESCVVMWTGLRRGDSLCVCV